MFDGQLLAEQFNAHQIRREVITRIFNVIFNLGDDVLNQAFNFDEANFWCVINAFKYIVNKLKEQVFIAHGESEHA